MVLWGTGERGLLYPQYFLNVLILFLGICRFINIPWVVRLSSHSKSFRVFSLYTVAVARRLTEIKSHNV